MAILSNINDLFRVDSAGAVYFGTSAGTNGQILKSVGTGGSPVWIDQTDVTGPFVLKAGDTMTGNLAINASNSLSVGGTISGGSSITGVSIIGTSRVQSDDNMFMVGGQFYIGADNSSTNDTYRFYAASGVYYLQSRKSGTWTTYLSIGSDAHAAFSGQVSATHFDSTSTTANIFLGSVITKPGDNLGFIVRNTTNAIIGSLLRTSNTTSKLTTDNLSLGGTTAQYVRGDGSFATYSPGTGTVTGSGTDGQVTYWTSATNVTSDTGFIYNGAGRVTSSESFGVSKDGADTVVDGPFFVLRNAAGTRQYANQLDASNNIDYWYYNGSTWTQTISLLTDGGATFAGSVTAAGGTMTADTTFNSNIILEGNIFHKDDTNTYFGFNSGSSGDDTIVFATNNVQRLTIDSSGNSTFAGNVTISQPTNGAEAKLTLTSKSAAGNSRTGIIEYDADVEKIFFINEGSTIAAMTSDGKVGIGVDSPGAKLDVLQEARVSYANSNQYTLRITNTDGNPRILADGSAAHLIFGTTPSGSATATERVRIQNDGNVGIGTTSPDSLLVVQADAHNEAFAGKRSATEFLWFLRNESNSGRFQLFNSSSSQTIEMTGANGRINQAQMIAGTAFALSNGGFATLGSTSSSVPIAIAIDGDASTASIVVPTNKNVCIGGVYNYAGTGVTSLNINGGDYPLLAFYSGSTLRTTLISYSNNTLFYHALSSAKWQFENGTGIMGELSGSGTLTVKGDVVAYGSPSDISLKENIKPIKNPLGKIKKLKGVTFDWKKSESILDIKEDYGFIAQDVKKIVPELVRKNENELLSMRHQGVIPILVEAIKELEARVKELENK